MGASTGRAVARQYEHETGQAYEGNSSAAGVLDSIHCVKLVAVATLSGPYYTQS